MSKVSDAAKLLKSKTYILVTETEGILAGNFKGFDGVMKIHSLRMLTQKANELLDKLQATEKKGKTNGRNSRGRKTRSPNKSK